MTRPVHSLVCSAALILSTILAASPAAALDIHLDYDTDGNPYTFQTWVPDQVTVPVDIVMTFGPADLGITSIQLLVRWGYGGQGPEPACFDVYGGVNFVPYSFLPDSGPFTNIWAYSCVCRGGLRCVCASEMVIDASVDVTQPGNYVLATLDFTRVGIAKDCTAPTYARADFDPFCIFPNCPGGGTLTIIDETALGSGDPIETGSWGRVKAQYR